MACIIPSCQDGECVRTRHFLCAGDCVEIRAVQSSFVCRLELRGPAPSPQLGETGLMVPGGHVLPPPAPSARRALLVEVENPQDGPTPEAEPLQAPSSDLGALGLQVVPLKRVLLPLKYEPAPRRPAESAGGASPSWRLRCGAELEIRGDLLATATASEGGRMSIVAEGSYDSSVARVWALSPPHRWGRGTRSAGTQSHRGEMASADVASCWRKLAEVDLSAVRDDAHEVSGFGSAQMQRPRQGPALRLAGLAVWRAASGLQVHALLNEARAAVFGLPRASAALELKHRFIELHTDAPRAGPETDGCGSASATASGGRAGLRDAVALQEAVAPPGGAMEPAGAGETAGPRGSAALAAEISGVRQELQAVAGQLRELRGDVRMLAQATEAMAAACRSQTDALMLSQRRHPWSECCVLL